MLKYVFIAAFLFHATISGLHQLQESWLDDVDGPKFLRGAEEEIQEDSENDFAFADDLKRVALDDAITATSIICDVAASPQGTTTAKWDKKNTVALATQHACADPYPTMVELDWPDDSVKLIPSIVLLHRCVGECLGKHNIQNCTVMEQEEVMLKVIEITNSNPPNTSIKDITVYNHTKCGCACRTRKSDCNTAVHDYLNGTCECKCKQALSKSCNTSIQWFNDKTCQCECNSAPKHCDSRNNNEEWNRDICDCDCREKIKDRCNRKGKVLNKSKCECECPKPLPACPAGTSFLKYNCTCIDTSVSTK